MSIEAVTGAQAISIERSVKPSGVSPANEGVAEATEQAGKKEVYNTARSLDDVLTGYNISLKFSRDDQTGRTVVELVDYQSGETLRQMPSEVSLHLTAMFGKLQGRLFNRQA